MNFYVLSLVCIYVYPSWWVDTLKNVLLNRLWSPGDNCKPTSDTWDTEHSEQ